jgi:hypothetical protein
MLCSAGGVEEYVSAVIPVATTLSAETRFRYFFVFQLSRKYPQTTRLSYILLISIAAVDDETDESVNVENLAVIAHKTR